MADPSMMKKTPVEKAVAAQVPLIETRNLVKKFGAFTALNGVSLKVYSG